MSTPQLTLWDEFVCRLEVEAGIAADSARISPEIRAQRACTILQNRDGRAGFLAALDRALRQSDEAPSQTLRLAEIPWPLVVSSNYDDLFYYACQSSKRHGDKIQVLGRSAKDCKLVVSSLSGPFDRRYIWHVQGFLGDRWPLTTLRKTSPNTKRCASNW